jgi:ribose 5-phosphate isomerase B
VEDVGAREKNAGDDYVDYAMAVAEKVRESDENRGILLCGSGHGVDMTANRYRGVRSILAFNVEVARQGREHENANVVSIPADWVSEDEAWQIVENFVKTDFAGEERHKRRLEKLARL